MAELNYSLGNAGKHALKKMPVRVDLTAMVDLAFLLITFFMLTTSLSKPRLMSVAMPPEGPVPESPAGPVPESRSMTVCLGKNNQVLYYLGLPDKPLISPQIVSSGESLRKALVETGRKVFANTGKDLIVVLKPAQHSLYANLVDALDELDIANVKTYAITKISDQDVDMLKQHSIY